MLGALSLLLNGGGVGQLQTITRELNKTLARARGRGPLGARTRSATFSGQLDRHKQDIVRALEALNRLSTSLNQPARHHRRRRSTSCPARCTRSTASATTWSGCSRRWPTSAASASA